MLDDDKKKKKILIVEDNLSLFSVYKAQLLMAGYEVENAPSAKEGLAKIKEWQPDLVLLDLKFPGEMQGDAMLEELRQHDWGTNVPVIILTNVSRSEAPQSLRFLNVEEFIVKSLCSQQQISQVISRVFSELDYRNKFQQ